MTDHTGPKRRLQHYFTGAPEVASREQRVTVTVRGLTMELWTDAGVFSHGRVDRGSLLLARELQVPPGASVLDWGAGYGFLGLVVAQIYPECSVTLAEINERAAALAERNARDLRLENARVVAGEAPGSLGDARYQVIVSNPPLRAGRAVVEGLLRDAADRLLPGGELWLVIPTNKGAQRYLAYLKERYAAARTVAISGGYRVLWARKAADEP